MNKKLTDFLNRARGVTDSAILLQSLNGEELKHLFVTIHKNPEWSDVLQTLFNLYVKDKNTLIYLCCIITDKYNNEIGQQVYKEWQELNQILEETNTQEETKNE